ncbi:MAG: hypothetical protein JOZ18_19705 [Chloroflexi bacterium]|nr:hypothetical protein [Chloroflexota bacterium]
MQRIIGRLLISLAVLATAIIPIRSDWNDSHVFSTQWSPHARFHGIVSIGMPVLLAPVALWLLWRRSADPDAAATVAALIPVAYWGPFFVALLVPGAAIVDPRHRLKRICGVPSPLFGASATILVAGLGRYLDHRGRTARQCIAKSGV